MDLLFVSSLYGHGTEGDRHPEHILQELEGSRDLAQHASIILLRYHWSPSACYYTGNCTKIYTKAPCITTIYHFQIDCSMGLHRCKTDGCHSVDRDELLFSAPGARGSSDMGAVQHRSDCSRYQHTSSSQGGLDQTGITLTITTSLLGSISRSSIV